MLNEFYIKDDLVEIVIPKKYGCNVIAIIDLEDLDLVKNIGLNKFWIICGNNKNEGYIAISIGRAKKLLHREILRPKLEEIIIFKNNNTLDCRKLNLKINLRTEYIKRQKNDYKINLGITKRNKSGMSGVYYDKAKKGFFAQITINKKKARLGRFDSMEEAIKARKYLLETKGF